MEEMFYIWIGALVLFIVLEAATAGITSLWFVLGSLAALGIAVLGWAEWLQVGVFLTVSLTTLFLLRPLVKKYIDPKKERTNVDALIGQQGLVLEKIDNLSGEGRVKLGGMEWSARSETGETIEVGTVIQVEKIEGVKVFVTAAKVTADK